MVLTRALVLALETIQINALDHLIVSPDSVFNFPKEGFRDHCRANPQQVRGDE